MKKIELIMASLATLLSVLVPVSAQAKPGDPVAIGVGFTLDPMLDLRLRYEHVDQPASDADAMTVRIRPGLQISSDIGLSFLIEGEATLGIIKDYNDTNAGNGVEPYLVVADPQNVELNRIQINYTKKGQISMTVGRQRINLDDLRFVGSVGWRQNEQTFDAVSASVTALKPFTLEGAYAVSQRTIFGTDAGPREAFNGEFVFLGAGTDLGPVKIKGFSYLIDFDAGQPVSATSSQTYGGYATARLPLSMALSLNLAASYAVQMDYAANPNNYSVDYIAGSAGISFAGFGLIAGYENLGSDGAGNRFQTPLATLHKFNGWADLFLSTPATGLKDKYISLSNKFSPLGGVTTTAAYHDFSSDIGSVKYGTEFDAEITFKIKVITVGIKYANYKAQDFGADTEKLWLQLGYGF